jgi:hypothetical protein
MYYLQNKLTGIGAKRELARQPKADHRSQADVQTKKLACGEPTDQPCFANPAYRALRRAMKPANPCGFIRIRPEGEQASLPPP